MKDYKARPPKDYSKFLATDEPVFVVGGQAVNLWALYYYDRTSDLFPFVSRDVDVLGTRDTLACIAEIAGVEPQFFPFRPPTNEVGVVIAKGTDEQPMMFEVLKEVYGVKNEELQNPKYTICIDESGVFVYVPSPVALLQAKVANVADLSQTGRQDKRHVCILTRLIPAYLKDIQLSVKNKRIKERDMLNILERLLTVVSSSKGKTVLNELEICRYSMFSELVAEEPSKLHSFMTKRLERVIPTP